MNKPDIMNKSNLVEIIANSADISKTLAAKVCDDVLGGITDHLANSGHVILVGFGSFTVRDRAAREGRNPKTGETIKIQAAKIPVFKPGKGLKDAVQGKR